MTKEEFDDFLKPLGLIWDWTNQPVENSAGFEIGSGWYELTKNLITDLIALGWDKRICQVKEKFGGGRFYIDEHNEETFQRIQAWENDTFKTCEQCGSTNSVTTGGKGWEVTLCDTCRNKPKD